MRPEQATEIAAGQKLFGGIGCAVCHRPKFGDVEGIYSDLLLHDMGQSLSGSGFYGTNVEFVQRRDRQNHSQLNRDAPDKPTREKPPKFGAAAREWRTPPLWASATQRHTCTMVESRRSRRLSWRMTAKEQRRRRLLRSWQFASASRLSCSFSHWRRRLRTAVETVRSLATAQTARLFGARSP